MQIDYLPIEALLARLEQDVPVLTVNKRLARYLRQAYDRLQQEGGRTAWKTPPVRAFGAWQRQLAGRLLPDTRFLEPDQALRLWERAVETDLHATGEGLMRVPDAAREAGRAHRLLVEYDANFQPEEGGDDHRAFLRWRRNWQELCRAGGWDDPALLSARLVEALQREDTTLPGELYLAGFDDLPPMVVAFCRTLKERGAKVRRWMPPGCADATTGRVACADPEEEVRHCARWARHLLAEGAQRIGVVAVEMDTYQARLQRIFREELSPAALLPGARSEVAFNLSLGTRLPDEGMVAAALEWLSLGHTVSLDSLSYLLRSPFVWGHLSEQHARALFDRELRNLRMNELPLNQVLRRAEQGFKRKLGRCDLFARQLETVRASLAEAKPRLPGAWARHFARLLEACQWPGDRSLDSRDYQVFTHFKEVLAGMGRLDAVSEPMSRGEALSLLRRLAAEQIFQPEGSQGRVQVLGTLEAAGMQFDALWLLGMHEEALPAPARPSPFIPPALQSRLGMPHADAARELDFARKLTGRLLGSAPLVLASWPLSVEGRERRPSPLVQHLPAATPLLADSRRPALLVRGASPALDAFTDARGPGIPTDGKVSGGTAILKDQALCPFRAYARHRLGAAGLASGSLGLDGLDRGSLVHRILELSWRRLGDWQALTHMADGELERLILRHIDKALDELEKERCVPLPPSQRALEKQRLLTLLREWFAFEAQRPPFSIESIETWHREHFDRLILQTRIDRIDRLADGTQVIIDYKTGSAGISDWLGERPVEPQLPLYTLGRDGAELAAVAFARVKGGDCAFVGLGREGAALPGVAGVGEQRQLQAAGLADWDDLLRHWRTVLEQLGGQFAAGHAAVDPINSRQACEWCDLHPLCRIADSDDAPQQEEPS